MMGLISGGFGKKCMNFRFAPNRNWRISMPFVGALTEPLPYWLLIPTDRRRLGAASFYDKADCANSVF